MDTLVNEQIHIRKKKKKKKKSIKILYLLQKISKPAYLLMEIHYIRREGTQ